MNVPGRMIRVQNEPFDVCRAEMEYARFMVIDPNDGMVVMLAHRIGPFLAVLLHFARDLVSYVDAEKLSNTTRTSGSLPAPGRRSPGRYRAPWRSRWRQTPAPSSRAP